MTLTPLRATQAADSAATGAADGGGNGPTDTGIGGLLGRELTGIQQQLAGLADASTFALSGRELTALVAQASAVASSLGELQARLVAEADSRDHASDQGCTSTTAWLRITTGVSGASAGRVSAQARHVFTDRAALTRVAWAAGRLSGEQALVIAEAVNLLSADVDPDRVAAAQADLIGRAGEHTLEELRQLANRMVEVVDPDSADAVLAERLLAEEQRALETTRLWFTRCGDGTTRFSGRLPDLQADMFTTALRALAAPRRRSLSGQHSPQDRGTCGDGVGSADGQTSTDETSADETSMDETSTDETGLTRSPVLNPDGDHSGTEIGVLTAQQRLGRALIELLEHLPADRLPQAGGLNASVVVSMDLDVLTGRLGSAVLDTGTVISGDQARRLACNATLVPVVLDGRSKVLDLG